MLGKLSKFFEDHIEKVVLVIVGVISFWILITNVVISSNHIEYAGRRFRPGAIDDYILTTEAVYLQERLEQEPEPPEEEYAPTGDRFVAMLDSAIDIDTAISPPVPIYKMTEIIERRYAVPTMPALDSISAGRYRTVALLPQERVTMENPYDSVETERGDIDLVSMQADFDFGRLRDEFNRTFAGDAVKTEWQDETLAKPVLAGIEVQRQHLLDDEQWSDWQSVPRPEICSYRELLSGDVNEEAVSRGSMRVMLLQLDEPDIQKEIIQPQAYRVVLADDRWLPPSLYGDYARIIRDIESEQRRLDRAAEREREAERDDRTDRDRSTDRDRDSRRRDTGRTPTGMGGAGFDGGMTGMMGTDRERRRPTERRDPDDRDDTAREDRLQSLEESLADIEERFAEISLHQAAELDDEVVVWSHDDSVEPGRTYRYRIRLGAFNPIAGTDQFAEGYEDYADQHILWTDFTEPTPQISIPERIYFFPVGIQETVKMTNVQVSRYKLGYWYSREFSVRPGELIGRETDPRLSDDLIEEGAEIPETVDFTTGAAYVDARPVNIWTGTSNLRPQQYFDMLYTYDGVDIQRLGIIASNWPSELQSLFADIRREERRVRKPFGEADFDRRTPIRRTRDDFAPGDFDPMMDDFGPGMDDWW